MDDKQQFEQSLLRRVFQLLDEADQYYQPPTKDGASDSSPVPDGTSSDGGRRSATDPQPSPQPPRPEEETGPAKPATPRGGMGSLASTPSIASVRSSLGGFISSCSAKTKSSRWRDYVAPVKPVREEEAPPSATTAAPAGKTAPAAASPLPESQSPSAAKRTPSPQQMDLADFLKVCLASTGEWRTEYTRRIEHAFGIQRELIQADGAIRMLSPSLSCCGVGEEERCGPLLKLLAISVPDYGFDARAAALMDAVRLRSGLSRQDYIKYVELNLAEQLKKGYLSEKEQDLQAQSSAMGEWKKKSLIGLGVVAGGVALAVTAGMAAPVVLPVFATLFGAAYLAGATATTLFIAVFGVGGASLAAYKMERRYQDIEEFAFVPITEDEQMRIAIGISGWLVEDDDLVKPWGGLAVPGVDALALKCQTEEFKVLGSKMKKFITEAAVKLVTVQALKTTALEATITALSWPTAVIQAGQLIDNRKFEHP